MSSRTRSRKQASIGSNHSLRRPTPISASEPRTGNFVLLLVMAWSPPAHNAGNVRVSAPGDYANLNGARLSGANLSRANLFSADLSNVRLHGAILTGADLTAADLSGASLTDATVTQAQLDQACGTDVKLDPRLTIKPCP